MREFMTVFQSEARPRPQRAPANSRSSPVGQPVQSPGGGRRRMLVRRARQITRAYPRPFGMLGLLLVSLALDVYHDGVGDPLALVVIVVGATPLVRQTIVALRQRRF